MQLLAVTKHLTRSNLREWELTWAHSSRRYSPAWGGGGGSRLQEQKMAGHVASVFGKQRGARWYSAHLFLFVQSSMVPSSWNGATSSYGRPSISINLETASQTCSEFVSMVILNHAKLEIKMNLELCLVVGHHGAQWYHLKYLCCFPSSSVS